MLQLIKGCPLLSPFATWQKVAAALVVTSLPAHGTALAQTFPPLTGRVVDAANLLQPDELND